MFSYVGSDVLDPCAAAACLVLPLLLTPGTGTVPVWALADPPGLTCGPVPGSVSFFSVPKSQVPAPGISHNNLLIYAQTVLRIRIHRIHMFLGLPGPDPLVRGMDPDPDPSIIMHK
jgi:hypothetical protein